MSSPSPSNCSPALERKWCVRNECGWLVSLSSGGAIYSPNKSEARRYTLVTVLNCFEFWDREEAEPENASALAVANPPPAQHDQ